MDWLRRIVGKKKAVATQPPVAQRASGTTIDMPTPFPTDRKTETSQAPKSSTASGSFTEKDNRGTRHDTLEHANRYWMARMTKQEKAPFVMYRFDSEGDAREALLELACIRMAEDSHKLICTETLIFGYWRAEDGKYEAVVCGTDLTEDLWEQAKGSFETHRGSRKNDLRPERRATPPKKQEAPDLAAIAFLREERQPGRGGIATYRIYKAPDASTAKAFLAQNVVTKPMFYIMVETPDGNYGRDIDGIYKEGE